MCCGVTWSELEGSGVTRNGVERSEGKKELSILVVKELRKGECLRNLIWHFVGRCFPDQICKSPKFQKTKAPITLAL